MKWFSSLSIRNKLIIIILAVSLIVVSIIGAARIAWDGYQGRQTLVQELSTLMQLIGDRSSAAMAFDDTNLAEENLSSLQTMTNITEACLYRTDNTLLAHYQKNPVSQSYCKAIKNKPAQQHWFDENHLNVSSDISQGLSTLGWIYLSSDFSLIELQRQDQLIFALLALICAALISVLLANWAQRLISTPILKITQIAKSIEEEQDTSLRVNLSGKDEVAQLAKSFNSMLDALEIKNEQLRRSQKMDALGKLTGGIAHDYNNMLGVVLGYSDLLKSSSISSAKEIKYVDEIIHAGERGARLTQKLLAFSRKKSSDASIVNINKVLQDEQHMLEKTLTARVKLIYKLHDDLDSVCLDVDDLEDAILNMSINAMHAMANGGQLTIETYNETLDEREANSYQLVPGDYVILNIIDTGTGIDKALLNNIFDPFYSTKGDKGTGLGLSQVYGFVTSSNGTIKVESESGKGTKFSLLFPSHKSKKPGISHKVNNKNNIENNGEVILVVDDEAALCKLTAEVLSNNGYEVIYSDSAIEALKILDENRVDVLFSDVIMPEMDGYELASIVKKKHPSVKIQLTSGFSDEDNISMFDDELHIKLIRKPYSSQTLLNTINKLLNE